MVFGHKYRLFRKVTDSIREVECKRCKEQFGMHDVVKVLVPLDDELRHAHNIILKNKTT